MRRDAREDVGHLRHWCGEQNDVRISHLLRHIVADAVEDAELFWLALALLRCARNRPLRRPRQPAQRQRKRPADQSDAKDDDFAKGGCMVTANVRSPWRYRPTSP